MPFHDKLPESFFTELYPDLDQPENEAWNVSLPTQGDRLHRLIECWPGAVFCLDPHLRCLLVNREARSWCIKALHPDDPPQPVHELLSPELLEALLPYISAALGGMELAFDEQFEHPSLGLRRLAIRTQPDHDQGHIAGVFLHLQDTTDLHHATQLAQDHHQQQTDLATQAQHPVVQATRLHLLAENLRDTALFTLDSEGRVLDWPASAERLLGYRAEVVQGISVHSFDDTNTPGENPDTLVALERATFLGQCDATGWRCTASGHRFWSQLVITTLHAPDTGEPLGYACLLRDMTEVKRLEDLLRHWNHELEVRVAERTQQLQDINQDLEAFSYSVSHDLRAPLRHISSFVDMLREDLGTQADPMAIKHLDTIAQSTSHMGQLIEGLLAFSRLGRAPLTRRDVAMSALLQSSLNRVQHDPTLQRPDSEVQWSLAADLPTVPGDAMLLSQVWDNLLSNALKYSRKREVAHIEVYWHRLSEQEVQFCVRDNGVGFNPQRADRLFGVFQRLHRASEFEGTGIGLALCRRIIERHGGRIWAESQAGAGSSFYFTLPSGASSSPADGATSREG